MPSDRFLSGRMLDLLLDLNLVGASINKINLLHALAICVGQMWLMNNFGFFRSD